MAIVVIDGGTTNTRVLLVHEGKVIGRATGSVGVRDTAIDGNNARLKAGVTALFNEAAERAAAAGAELCIERGLALGMITSPLGLCEVPHLLAPAGVAELGAAVVWTDAESLGEWKLGFVPGVKSLPGKCSLDSIGECDFMRGEETQVMGLIQEARLNESALVVIVGSHTKFIKVNGKGQIVVSLTTLGGELVGAIKSNTVIASSLPESLPSAREPFGEAVSAGARLGRSMGFTRAVFAVRLLDQILEASGDDCFDFLSGIVAGADIEALANWRPMQDVRRASIVGNPFRTALYAKLMSEVLPQGTKIDRLSEDSIEAITVRGALAILESSEEAIH